MHKRDPKVDVIIVNWNGKEFLKKCLGALSKQKFRDFSVTVVDNDSDDGSRDYVRHHHDDVKLLELDDNYGFAYPNNAGIKNSTGKYVVLLNNDTIPDTGWLGELVKVMEEEKKWGFCASKVILSQHGNQIDTAGDFYSIAGCAGKYGHLDRADKEAYLKYREVFGASAGAAIYRRSMLEDIGFFDEDFFIVQEDVDLSFRARLNGYSCCYVPRAEVLHYSHGSIGNESSKYVYYSHRNMEFVYFKNTPLPLIFLSLPFHLADSLFSFIYYLGKGKWRDFLRGKFDAMLSMRKIMKKRRRIQQKRRISVMDLFRLFRKDWPLYKFRLFLRKLRS